VSFVELFIIMSWC